ncbi:hypothetical protein MTO96_015712 [Rhipicephalus appendiculatus]
MFKIPYMTDSLGDVSQGINTTLPLRVASRDNGQDGTAAAGEKYNVFSVQTKERLCGAVHSYHNELSAPRTLAPVDAGQRIREKSRVLRDGAGTILLLLAALKSWGFNDVPSARPSLRRCTLEARTGAVDDDVG